MYQTLKEITTILLEILPWIPAVIIIRLVVNLIRHKRGIQTTFWHELGVGLFLIYLIAVLQKTVPFISFLAGFRLKSTINLVPFNGILAILKQGEINYVLLNIVGNIVMFIPLGFFIPLLWKKARRTITVLAYGFGLSLLIEALQFLINRGTDIDDLILNIFGAILGYIFYTIFSRLFPHSCATNDKVSPQSSQ